tara:strand:+ start:4660 stop:4836 length:177 start_codon:yes stop_codon:yes gene_type:complete
MSKGSKDRVKDKKSFNENFDRIFGKRNASKVKDENVIPDKYQSITSDNADYFEQTDNT